MCEKGNEVVLELPADIEPGKINRTISCDGCCVEVLKKLWSENIQTKGHCCGHGQKNPSIVIADGYEDFEINRILSLIAEVDERQWDIFQWRLIKVNISKDVLRLSARDYIRRKMANNELKHKEVLEICCMLREYDPKADLKFKI